ncbi:unnamed protein product [Rotaria magnacalcarata]|uniref:Uncharacterized protein n=1 Tax=Rotaria magnacalcarata TaxID=392030 RepID=A0A8S2LNF0_9BILA|nr:unnamed protein product [Rotaria magnacalcarata]CAF3931174.1 unnamed protein product [Rotaria magnacalcarata]CAF3934179.1 unnamed protein product [Rotaria magnacalcarata]
MCGVSPEDYFSIIRPLSSSNGPPWVGISDRIGCSSSQICKEICGNEALCTDIVYPLSVIELMPRDLRGLMLASQGGRLFDYIHAINFLAILWKRVNEEAAFWGLIFPPYALSHTDQRPDAIKFHYLYFAILLFVLTCLITITISLLTRPIPDQCLHGLNIFDLNNPV